MLAVLQVPDWLQYCLATTSVASALAVGWRMLLRPALRVIDLANRVVPLLQEAADTLADEPAPFHVLADIVAEFHNDSGSTLRDAIDRIEDQQRATAQAVAELDARMSAPRRRVPRECSPLPPRPGSEHSS